MQDATSNITHGRPSRAHAFLIPALLCLMVFVACAGAGQPIVATDLFRIRTISSIDVSRDGSLAVFSVNSIGFIPADATDHAAVTHGDVDAHDATAWKPVNQSHLWAVSLVSEQASPRQLTFGHRRDSQPQISPDGKHVAFVREGGEDAGDGAGLPQVWMLPLAGAGEARQITFFKHGASQPRWLPNNQRLLVSSSLPMSEIEGAPDWPSERPRRTHIDATLPDGLLPSAEGTREQIRAWLHQNEQANRPRLITRLEYQGELQLLDAHAFAQLFVVDVLDSHSIPKQITNRCVDHVEAAVMPDGRSIVYAAHTSSTMHPDRVRRSDLWMVNIDGSVDRSLLSIDGWSLGAPKPSRDGAVVAFTAERIDTQSYRLSRLGIVPVVVADPAQPREATWLTDSEKQDGPILNYEWNTAQGASILFNTCSRGAYPLMTISFGLLEPATLVSEFEGTQAGAPAFDVGGGAIVYSLASYANPCVLMIRDTAGDRELFNLNDWVQEKTVSRPREGWIIRPDGQRVQYWLMEPTERQPRQKYPLVLNIHGGPMWMWGPGEHTMWLEFQLMCSFGYGVVYANPRGSTGYTEAFMRGNVPDWGEGPAGDVLGAVDQVILEDWVDRNKLVITGGSYGGYLTAWIIANDHRFKAAVAQRGVYDFATFFGEGNAWRLVEDTFGGLPFESRLRDVIARNNPFTAVARIRTPLLIIHADKDLRTGVSQSEMMYRALKALGKPVEYARYPDSGHDLSRTGEPTLRVDRLLRIIEFFDRHVENARPAPQVLPAAPEAAVP